jgi:putative acetyltransferase
MIRPFTESDADELIDVWYRASLIAHPFLSEAFLASERTQIVERWLPVTDTSVYVLDGKVVGSISMMGNEVGGFFVDPEYQRRGIGRALMDHARDTRPHLELDVFEANAIGRRFYDKYGFELVERHIHAETGQPELRLRLG